MAEGYYSAKGGVKGKGTRDRYLALARLVARVRLVDDEHPPLAADKPVGPMPATQGLQRIPDLHDVNCFKMTVAGPASKVADHNCAAGSLSTRDTG